MGHRHLANGSQFFGTDLDRNHIASGQFYNTGRVFISENGSFSHPVESVPTRGHNSVSLVDRECRLMEQSSRNFGLEGPQIHASVSGPNYDVFPNFPASRSFYPAPDINAARAHSIHYSSHLIHEIEGGGLDGSISSRREPFKRKSPGVSISCERGSTSNFYGSGSSSDYFQLQLEKPSSYYGNYSSISTSLPPHRGHSQSIGTENPSRNVRSRSRLGLEPNPRRTHSSIYLSHPCGSTSDLRDYHQPMEVANLNRHVNADHIGVTPAHGRFQPSATNPTSREMNQYYGGSAPDIGGYYHQSISRRSPVSPLQNLHGIHSHLLREGLSCYPQRALPSYRSDLISPTLGQEPAASENRQLLFETYPYRYSRLLSAAGWHSSPGEGRPNIAIERFQSLSNAVDTHHRMRSEGVKMLDRSYYDSRNLYDEYRDLRLDIDNLSYEELLALGERIGNVNTGLSDDVISECLMETIYPADTNQEEASCAICLEEYKKMEKVGTVRNCGHEYHVACIKKWLSMKNACPICKAPALADSSNRQ